MARMKESGRNEEHKMCEQPKMNLANAHGKYINNSIVTSSNSLQLWSSNLIHVSHNEHCALCTNDHRYKNYFTYKILYCMGATHDDR